MSSQIVGHTFLHVILSEMLLPEDEFMFSKCPCIFILPEKSAAFLDKIFSSMQLTQGKLHECELRNLMFVPMGDTV
jgi:hypothetical protein